MVEGTEPVGSVSFSRVCDAAITSLIVEAQGVMTDTGVPVPEVAAFVVAKQLFLALLVENWFVR